MWAESQGNSRAQGATPYVSGCPQKNRRGSACTLGKMEEKQAKQSMNGKNPNIGSVESSHRLTFRPWSRIGHGRLCREEYSPGSESTGSNLSRPQVFELRKPEPPQFAPEVVCFKVLGQRSSPRLKMFTQICDVHGVVNMPVTCEHRRALSGSALVQVLSAKLRELLSGIASTIPFVCL